MLIRLAHINNLLGMNAPYCKEVRALEDRALNCRITGIGYLRRLPAQGTATIIYPGQENKWFLTLYRAGLSSLPSLCKG
jgi:hypothetical protein